MEQFSLEKYLETPSRKVVTRDGRPVRIVCWNLKCNTPIIAAIQWNQEREDCYCYNTKGWCANNEGELDLFFADEEELTEFEKELQIIISDASHWTSDDGSISTYCQFGDKEIKKISGQILDLARKELEANYYTKVLDDRVVFKSDLHDRDMQGAYELGKQDALKDLPKWKKATEHKDLEKHIAILEEDKVLLSNYLEEGDYYIELSDLKTLPKEE